MARNVRELRNVMERAVLLAQGPVIGSEEIGLQASRADPLAWRPGLPPEGLALAEIERAILIEALERTE